MLNLKKLLTKILTEYKRTTTVYYGDVPVLANSYISISYPSGYYSNDTIIVQPRYSASSQLGWTATIQQQASNIIIYVRIGANQIAQGTKLTFDVTFIKH